MTWSAIWCSKKWRSNYTVDKWSCKYSFTAYDYIILCIYICFWGWAGPVWPLRIGAILKNIKLKTGRTGRHFVALSQYCALQTSAFAQSRQARLWRHFFSKRLVLLSISGFAGVAHSWSWGSWDPLLQVLVCFQAPFSNWKIVLPTRDMMSNEVTSGKCVS